MRRFASLYQALDRTTSTGAKREAIVAHLREAPAADAAWAVFALAGGKLRRVASSSELRQAVESLSGLPGWLIEESYQQVGDLAETIALVLPGAGMDEVLADRPLADWLEQALPAVARLAPAARITQLQDWWRQLPAEQVFLLNKLLTGSLRVGVSRRLVVQALAEWARQPSDLIAHRFAGDWQPSAAALEALAAPPGEQDQGADRPYPFFLASPLEAEPASLGDAADWLAEWKWDGIRAQLMRRQSQVALWSRGEDRLDGRFPELETAARTLAGDGVIDGEVLAWDEARQQPRPFAALQKRIGKRRPGARLLQDTPVIFMAYDLLERQGEDLRELPLLARRQRLEQWLATAPPALRQSPSITAEGWQALAELRQQSRDRQTEGLMLKRLDSPYRVGRKRGDWWKWKIDPYTLDAVLLYAQPGHGRRSGLFTDYTFGVWQDDVLVPVAKAYSGLDDEEISRLDRWIRAHTTERFGPVRAVPPMQVFELAFEAIQASSRHKAGVAVRFPRILRWRHDLSIHDAERLDQLQALAQR